MNAAMKWARAAGWVLLSGLAFGAVLVLGGLLFTALLTVAFYW